MDFFGILFNLLLGGAAIIMAVVGLIKRWEGTFWSLVLGVFGALLLTLGLLNLTGMISAKWLYITRNAFIGVCLILSGVAGLYSPPSPKYPRWTQWAMVVIGAGSIFFALIELAAFFRESG